MTDLAGAMVQLYAYDAYGNAIGFDPAEALTEFLYSGEQFDSKIGQQYLRQRYYDPSTGRFNRLDPFFGNHSDPQSFHKYAYVHGDPVNRIDPSGLFGVAGLGVSMSISSNMRTSHTGAAAKAYTFSRATIGKFAFFSALANLGIGAYVGNTVLHTIGEKGGSDGFLFSVSFSAGTHGFQGTLEVGIYVSWKGSISVVLTHEFGVSPITLFPNFRKVNTMPEFAMQLCYNTDSVQDLCGPSIIGMTPWVMARWPSTWHGMLGPDFTKMFYAMHAMTRYLSANVNYKARPGSIITTQSLSSSDTCAIGYANLSYAFSTTIGNTYELLTFNALGLPNNIAQAVSKLTESLPKSEEEFGTEASIHGVNQALDWFYV